MSYSIPSELSYETLSRMYPSVKSEYRKQPFNTSSATSGSELQLLLNKMDRSFINPNTLCLNFNLELDFTVATAPATSTNSAAFLVGSAWSIFSRYVSKQAGGTDIDQIEFPGRLVNSILNMTLSPEEKRGMIGLGFNEDKPTENYGLQIPLVGTVGSNRKANRTFSIPLIGALSSSSKFIPLFAGDLQLNFTVASITECLRVVFSGALISNVVMTIKDVEIIGEVLTLEESAFNQMMQMYPNVLNIKTQSYSYASGQSVASQTQGVIDQLIPFSLNSLKQFIWWASPSDAWEGGLAGVCPNLNSYNLIIGSTSYPQQPVKCTSVSECYYQNSKSFGSFYSSGHSGSSTRTQFGVASTVGGEYAAYDSSADLASLDIFKGATTLSNKWFACLDLEVINQLKLNLYSGISTRGSSNILRLNIGRPLANVTHSIHMYACYDVVLNFDYANGRITYSN